mmetsp:Transcript_29455/g.53962  ORF Transcript_29455/g.53962 Transcript_29455/m.53962 type:complete len:260 (+) Transcript_29455:625-1404(+)
MSPNNKWWQEGDEKYAETADATELSLVDFPPMLGQDAKILRRDYKRDYLLTTDPAKERARQLLEKGADFLYGLLFHECFGFQPLVRAPTDPLTNNKILPDHNELVASPSISGDEDYLSDKESITIVLHSRHSKESDDGSKIMREKLCLQRLLQTENDTLVCQVILLSDRSKTLETAKEYIAESYLHCTSMIAPHIKSASWRKEHGPFAGVGFYQDLAFVTNQIIQVPTSMKAFIGSNKRSSSQLVQELITYQLEQQRQK